MSKKTKGRIMPYLYRLKCDYYDKIYKEVDLKYKPLEPSYVNSKINCITTLVDAFINKNEYMDDEKFKEIVKYVEELLGY